MTHIPSTTTRGACFVSVTLKYTQNAGDYLKQVKASRPLMDDPRGTSDGRADRCAVFEKILVTPARSSSVFAAFV